MDVSLLQLTPTQLALIPVLMAVVSLIKIYVNSFWSPLISFVLGIGGSVYFAPQDTLSSSILAGIVIGLTASGLYSGIARMVRD